MKYLKSVIFVFLVFGLGINCTRHSSGDKGFTLNSDNNNETTLNEINPNNLPEIKFEKEVHEFGRIYQGEKVSYTFKFKNIGLADLIIKEAKASCGCTVPKYSREPIPSGGEGEIEVIFDSSNRSGRQMKTITVWTNCQPEQNKLEIISEIVVPN